MRVRVKICGIKEPTDVAAASGADALGAVVEVPRSPRSLGFHRAAELFRLIPRGVIRVAVTTATDPGAIRRILGLRPHVLQLHVELPPRRWREIRALVGEDTRLWGLMGIGNQERDELVEKARRLKAAPLDGVVLDTAAGGRTGGTGTVHDWRRSRAVREVLCPVPVILAGGLSPGNVREAIRAVEPDWVDVSSGVEEKGEKCPEKIRAFLEAVRGVAE